MKNHQIHLCLVSSAALASAIAADDTRQRWIWWFFIGLLSLFGLGRAVICGY